MSVKAHCQNVPLCLQNRRRNHSIESASRRSTVVIERDLYSGLDRGQAPARGGEQAGAVPWLYFPQAYPIPYTFVSVYQSTDVFVYLSPIHRPSPVLAMWPGARAVRAGAAVS